MARNPKSDLVHKHNGLLGSVAFAKSGMQSVVNSETVSGKSKVLATDIYGLLMELQDEIKNNPQY